MASMTDLLQEIRSSNAFLLKRLNQIVSGQARCTCPCHNRDTNRETDLLRQRIRYLEEQAKTKEDEVQALRKQLHKFKDSLETMQRPSSLRSPKLNDISISKTKESSIPDNYNVPAANTESSNTDTKATVITSPHVNADEPRSSSRVTENNKIVQDLGNHKLETASNDGKSTTEEIKEVTPSKRLKFNIQAVQSVEGDLEGMASCVSSMDQAEEDLQGVNDNNKDQPPTVEQEREPPASVRLKQSPIKAILRERTLSERLGVRVIEQTERRLIGPFDWEILGNNEQSQAQASEIGTLKGIFTVVCVDISYSMTEGGAWEQAKTFFKDVIEGLKESMYRYNISEESVALVTFGHKTEVLKRLTNDFDSLQTAFDGLSLGGPSPMFGGLSLSIAAAQSPLAFGGANVNGIPVLTKMVLITDGHVTPSHLVAGPDIVNPSEQEQTKNEVLQLVEKMEGRLDVYCVPVGNSDTEFLELLTSVSDGKMLTYRDGRKIGTRLRQTLLAGGGRLKTIFDLIGNNSDEEDIKEILETAERRSENIKKLHYLELNTEKLPKIGTRVRRGPDWKWNNQDDDGPGTVIGHLENDDAVWVEWDNNSSCHIYRYDPSGGYDVLIVDEPRIPKPDGRLAVGCIVKPGQAWKYSTRRVKVTDKGIVIKVLNEERVQVRWENKERGDYSYGLDGPFEIEFCPPEKVTSPEVQGACGYSREPARSQYYVPSQPTAQSTKNKNKNIQNKNIVNKNTTNKK